MSNAIVRSRTNHAPTPAGSPAIVPLDELGTRMQLANAISKAGAMLPKCYQSNPGAILLLMSWAEKHGKDILTAGQGVQVDDQGRLIVSAEMRVELANDRGFDITDITPDAERREQCTLRVRTPEGETHELTVRLEDIHESVRSLTTKSGKPTPWATATEDMLLRTAQRRADKRYCRTGALVLDAGQDFDDEPVDVVDVIAERPESEGDEDVVEAEVVVEDDDQADDDLTAPPITEDDLRAAGKVADLLRAAQAKGANVALVSDIVADQALAKAVLDEVAS